MQASMQSGRDETLMLSFAKTGLASASDSRLQSTHFVDFGWAEG
jgi:hypothetical protein